MEELEFLRRVHEQEVKELQALLAQAPADTREFFKNELALAIRDIKDEYDYIAKQGKQDMESWYKLKVSHFRKQNFIFLNNSSLFTKHLSSSPYIKVKYPWKIKIITFEIIV